MPHTRASAQRALPLRLLLRKLRGHAHALQQCGAGAGSQAGRCEGLEGMASLMVHGTRGGCKPALWRLRLQRLAGRCAACANRTAMVCSHTPSMGLAGSTHAQFEHAPSKV